MQNIDMTERRIDGREVYSGKILHVMVDKVELPNGNTSTREYVGHPGAVCVVPINEKGEVLCVRQYRYTHGRVFLEIPAGKLESGETDPDDDEFIDVEAIPLEKLAEMCVSGEISDGKTIAAVLKAKYILDKRK